MFNKLSVVTGIILLSSTVLNGGQVKAQTYNFENFNPGGVQFLQVGFSPL